VRNVVFLVKNGIGFGHIRRAILLAEAVREQGRLRPIVVSQASSLQLYTTTTIPVVNFPLLHRVSSAVAEDCYLDILDRLLEHLDPAVVIEDTYPDPRYLALTSLADRPRLLVMRRMDGESFDQIRELGRLAHYDRILIAQRPEEFAREGHSGHSTAAVESSGRFTFVGNLYHTPAEHAPGTHPTDSRWSWSTAAPEATKCPTDTATASSGPARQSPPASSRTRTRPGLSWSPAPTTPGAPWRAHRTSP
jgi:predicted glycosyltransferase